MTKTSSKRPLGRPVAARNLQVKNMLLESARQLFLSNDYQGVSVRQISIRAGVNPAMIKYYFGDKEGLYLALIDKLFAPLERQLARLDSNPEFNTAKFIQHYSRLLSENPWWPNFVLREVLLREGNMRKKVLQKMKSTMAKTMLDAISREINGGKYRKDLHPEFVLVSLMGLTVFPFLANPIIESLLNLKLDADLVPELVAHNTKLFLHGVHAVSADATSGDK